VAIAICILKGLEMNQLRQVAELKIPQWTESRRRIYTCNGLSPTLNGVGGGATPSLKWWSNMRNKIYVIGTLPIKGMDSIKRIYSGGGTLQH
jgi:hypothetical protein